MSLLINRTQLIESLCVFLREAIPDFVIVRPYHGELDRYSKKIQLKEETFPVTVNLATPFALVISKDRKRLENSGPSLKFRHDISIYVGVANRHDFANQNVPTIFDLLTRCTDALHGKVFFKGAGALNVESDGDYLITTDLFTVYDQKYYQLEIGR